MARDYTPRSTRFTAEPIEAGGWVYIVGTDDDGYVVVGMHDAARRAIERAQALGLATLSRVRVSAESALYDAAVRRWETIHGRQYRAHDEVLACSR